MSKAFEHDLAIKSITLMNGTVITEDNFKYEDVIYHAAYELGLFEEEDEEEEEDEDEELLE